MCINDQKKKTIVPQSNANNVCFWYMHINNNNNAINCYNFNSETFLYFIPLLLFLQDPPRQKMSFIYFCQQRYWHVHVPNCRREKNKTLAPQICVLAHSNWGKNWKKTGFFFFSKILRKKINWCLRPGSGFQVNVYFLKSHIAWLIAV